MNILAWNYRGCGGLAIIRNIKSILHSTATKLAFLFEMKCNSAKANSIISSLPLRQSYVVSAQGHSGGLWLLWDDSIKLQVLEASSQFIFSTINDPSSATVWIFGGVYGDSHHGLDDVLWGRIRHYATGPIPFCYMGDFNAITSTFEKIGGLASSLSRWTIFSSRIGNAGLKDLGFAGPAFTWSNR
ncbi:uncharacterized protein [Typha angustifolia]|uniref:uncharacterized protein n=1 Tax=Typha angustifolia TaxID=59011 RepID=UPI003C2BB63F